MKVARARPRHVMSLSNGAALRLVASVSLQCAVHIAAFFLVTRALLCFRSGLFDAFQPDGQSFVPAG